MMCAECRVLNPEHRVLSIILLLTVRMMESCQDDIILILTVNQKHIILQASALLL